MTFFGSSFISDEYGNKVAELNRDEENCLVYEFDFEKINKERRDWGVFRDRRVDLYSDLLKLSSK